MKFWTELKFWTPPGLVGLFCLVLLGIVLEHLWTRPQRVATAQETAQKVAEKFGPVHGHHCEGFSCTYQVGTVPNMFFLKVECEDWGDAPICHLSVRNSQ